MNQPLTYSAGQHPFPPTTTYNTLSLKLKAVSHHHPHPHLHLHLHLRLPSYFCRNLSVTSPQNSNPNPFTPPSNPSPQPPSPTRLHLRQILWVVDSSKLVDGSKKSATLWFFLLAASTDFGGILVPSLKSTEVLHKSKGN
ncbi:hypothetical protein HanIR_Chr10g0493461 [Helianthus annuus]|nr:hypothetical protein HanIR_Chr10g0493461 [Helianthus annuus]